MQVEEKRNETFDPEHFRNSEVVHAIRFRANRFFFFFFTIHTQTLTRCSFRTFLFIQMQESAFRLQTCYKKFLSWAWGFVMNMGLFQSVTFFFSFVFIASLNPFICTDCRKMSAIACHPPPKKGRLEHPAWRYGQRERERCIPQEQVTESHTDTVLQPSVRTNTRFQQQHTTRGRHPHRTRSRDCFHATDGQNTAQPYLHPPSGQGQREAGSVLASLLVMHN